MEMEMEMGMVRETVKVKDKEELCRVLHLDKVRLLVLVRLHKGKRREGLVDHLVSSRCRIEMSGQLKDKGKDRDRGRYKETNLYVDVDST